jgi:MFS transporter, DHA1 family, inner membrane transport protein
MTDTAVNRTLWVLLFGNLVIGTGILLPAGLLTAFTRDFRITPATAGWLMTLGGLVVGIGAPILAGLTARVDRRLLLAAALSLYVVGHIAAALAPSFGLVLVARAISVAGAAIFTPQAAATVGLLVSPERRGSAIAFIFVGWSLASVLGVPAATIAGEAIGWRATHIIVGGLSLVALIAVWQSVPRGLKIVPLPLSAWASVLRDARLTVLLAVTVATMAGQFAVFTYITAILEGQHGLSANAAALAFLLGGLFGVLGNAIAGRVVGQVGVTRTVMVALVAIGLGMGIAWAGWTAVTGFVIGICVWNLGAFAVNSMQQARLVGLAPTLASATIALNTSAVYLGQALGAWTGGQLLVDTAPAPRQILAAVGFVVLAAVLSALATWLAGCLSPRPAKEA